MDNIHARYRAACARIFGWLMTRLKCIALFISLAIGCRAMSPWPNRALTRQFDQVDRLSIGSPETGVQITSKESIERLRDIYVRAKWKPWIDTPPSDQLRIHAYSGTEELFSLDYGAGWLIEGWEDGNTRKGILNDEDQEWLSNLVKPEQFRMLQARGSSLAEEYR